MIHRIEKLLQRLTAPKPGPSIRWHDVIRIEAMGTDSFGAFEAWLVFIYSEGSKEMVNNQNKGYWDIVESLHTRFPSISPTWYEEMSKQPVLWNNPD